MQKLRFLLMTSIAMLGFVACSLPLGIYDGNKYETMARIGFYPSRDAVTLLIGSGKESSGFSISLDGFSTWIGKSIKADGK